MIARLAACLVLLGCSAKAESDVSPVCQRLVAKQCKAEGKCACTVGGRASADGLEVAFLELSGPHMGDAEASRLFVAVHTKNGWFHSEQPVERVAMSGPEGMRSDYLFETPSVVPASIPVLGFIDGFRTETRATRDNAIHKTERRVQNYCSVNAKGDARCAQVVVSDVDEIIAIDATKPVGKYYGQPGKSVREKRSITQKGDRLTATLTEGTESQPGLSGPREYELTRDFGRGFSAVELEHVE